MKQSIQDKFSLSVDTRIRREIDKIFSSENQLIFFGHLLSEQEMVLYKQIADEELLICKNMFLEGYQSVLNLAKRGSLGFPVKSFELDHFSRAQHPEWENLSNDQILTQLNKTILLQEICGYSPKMMREIYEAGCNNYFAKEYGQSLVLAYFLTVLNPTVFGFWQLLGRSYEAIEKWHQALISYQAAINCRPDKIEGYEEAVRCCVKSYSAELANKVIDAGFDSLQKVNDAQVQANLKNGLNRLKKELKA